MFALQTKFSRGVRLLGLLFALVLGMQTTARAGGKVPFHASYSINLVADFTAAPLVGITSQGSMLATHLGNVTTRSITETISLVNGEGNALHEFTAANGDVLHLKFHFFVSSTDQVHYDVAGTWEVVSGTGRYEGATGSGTYEGLAVFDSPTTAAANFELTGTVSSVGSLK